MTTHTQGRGRRGGRIVMSALPSGAVPLYYADMVDGEVILTPHLNEAARFWSCADAYASAASQANLYTLYAHGLPQRSRAEPPSTADQLVRPRRLAPLFREA